MTVQALRDAAQAVLDRWDSPAWEWHQGPTAALMADLRRALLDIEQFCDQHCIWADHHNDCVHGSRKEKGMNVFADQAAFMRACGQSTDHDNDEQAMMYERLCDEEREEWMQTGGLEGEVEDLDAVIDQIVVLIGYGLSRGWDMDGAWREVVRSNMSKVDPVTGMVRKREDGKVMKGPDFSPPNLHPFISKGNLNRGAQ